MTIDVNTTYHVASAADFPPFCPTYCTDVGSIPVSSRSINVAGEIVDIHKSENFGKYATFLD
jgi:hypothetical protein